METSVFDVTTDRCGSSFFNLHARRVNIDIYANCGFCDGVGKYLWVDIIDGIPWLVFYL